MRLSQCLQLSQSKTRYPQCKPENAGRQSAQNGAKSPRFAVYWSCLAVPGWWLVITRPVGLDVERSVSTHGMSAALACHLAGYPWPTPVLALPEASLACPSPAGHSAGRCRGAQPTGAAFSAQPCELGKGDKGGACKKSGAHTPETERIGKFLRAQVGGGGGTFIRCHRAKRA